MTLRDIGHDLAHAITHADHSIFALIRALVTRPGVVAHEYTEGKRKRHFGPFAFLLITVGLASAIILISGVQWFTAVRTRLRGQPAAAPCQSRDPDTDADPGAVLRGAVKGSAPDLAEHLVLAAYTSGLARLFLGVIETPAFAMTNAAAPDAVLAAAFFGLWFLYFALAASQFYSGNRVVAAIKGGIAVVSHPVRTVILPWGSCTSRRDCTAAEVGSIWLVPRQTRTPTLRAPVFSGCCP